MKKNSPTNPENVVCYDVDETLLMWNKEPIDIYVNDPYHPGTKLALKKHQRHIKLLKDHKARGKYIVVWSAGGYEWAKAAVKALELNEYVDHIMAKPICYVDDRVADDILGQRVYLEDTP